jgi:uncharacterized protein DUF1918
MPAKIGDRVALQPERIHALPRTGTVEAVLGADPHRYQIRWDDGKWSIIAPTDGALRVLSPVGGRKRASRPRAAAAKASNRG